MSPDQRYVSRELTHFVGRKESSEEARYAVFKSVLDSCWLARDPAKPGAPHILNIDGFLKMSANEMVDPGAICFCDIPPGDLAIHMDKYSRFGISFLKSFLLPKGANPVFYIANDSLLGVEWKDGRPTERAPRGATLDETTFAFIGLLVQRRIWEKGGHTLTAEVADHFQKMKRPVNFLLYHVFGHMKCFDASREDNDPLNYYMEREWRMVEDLRFDLSNVWRVILPHEYVRRFRQDFPGYDGQITFAEPGA